MNILILQPPGRFPTVSHDISGIWEAAQEEADVSAFYLPLHVRFWETICSPRGRTCLFPRDSVRNRMKSRLAQRRSHLDPAASFTTAATALESFRDLATFTDSVRHRKACDILDRHFSGLTRVLRRVSISLCGGVQILSLDIRRSAVVVNTAKRWHAFAHPLSRLIETTLQAGLEGLPNIDIVFVRITSATDLFTGVLASLHLRTRFPFAQLCLAEHEYENFSMNTYKDRLSIPLRQMFDNIWIGMSEKSVITGAVISAARDNIVYGGAIQASDLDPRRTAEPTLASSHRLKSGASTSHITPPPYDAFVPSPIIWTRISPRRCHWGRCAFCVQNRKHDLRLAPDRSEAEKAVMRLSELAKAGYRYFIFSDEAISAELMDRFCDAIVKVGLKIDWACRARLSDDFTPNLLNRMLQAGCREILVGVESFSPRMLTLMNKYPKDTTTDDLLRILKRIRESGVGLHINLLTGFPGDTLADVATSMEHTAAILKDMPGGSLTFNYFTLFAGSDAQRHPEKYEISPAPVPDDIDIDVGIPFTVAPSMQADYDAIRRSFPALRERLYEQSGFDATSTSVGLYMDSGHGLFFKTAGVRP